MTHLGLGGKMEKYSNPVRIIAGKKSDKTLEIEKQLVSINKQLNWLNKIKKTLEYQLNQELGSEPIE